MTNFHIRVGGFPLIFRVYGEDDADRALMSLQRMGYISRGQIMIYPDSGVHIWLESPDTESRIIEEGHE